MWNLTLASCVLRPGRLHMSAMTQLKCYGYFASIEEQRYKWHFQTKHDILDFPYSQMSVHLRGMMKDWLEPECIDTFTWHLRLPRWLGPVAETLPPLPPTPGNIPHFSLICMWASDYLLLKWCIFMCWPSPTQFNSPRAPSFDFPGSTTTHEHNTHDTGSQHAWNLWTHRHRRHDTDAYTQGTIA